MTLKLTCPACGTEYPIEAGLMEDDGKRLAAVVAGMEPVLARAALHYLRCFKPTKTALRISRAVKILQDLAELAGAGTVCRDERAGVRRPATPAMWAAGIEQMLQQRASLELPLANHNYLRKIVYGVADSADLAAERKREENLRGGRRDPPVEHDVTRQHLLGLESMFRRGFISREEYERQKAATCKGGK